MVNVSKQNTCCIIGHRKIIDNFENFKSKIWKCLINLIENQKISVFKFGFYGEFNDLCYNILSSLKLKYLHIKLVLYSLNNEIAFTFEEAESYKIKYEKQNKKFTYKCFDEIVYLNNVDETKFKYACVLRNKKLIDESDFCLIYFRENYFLPNNRNSGTKIAFDYAKKENKNIILI